MYSTGTIVLMARQILRIDRVASAAGDGGGWLAGNAQWLGQLFGARGHAHAYLCAISWRGPASQQRGDVLMKGAQIFISFNDGGL